MQREEIYQRVWGYAMVARRPLGRRVRAQAAPEAGEGVAGLALHPHALRDRLPVRGRAGRRGGRGAAGRGCRRPSPAPVAARGRGRPAAAAPRRRLSAAGLSFRAWARTATRTCATSDPAPARGRRLAAAGRRHGDRRRSTTSSACSSPAGSCSSATACTWSTARSLFMLEDKVRALLYGSIVLIALALSPRGGCGTRAASACSSGSR